MDNEPSKPGSDYHPTENTGASQLPSNTQTDQEHQRTVAALSNEKRKRKSKPILVILLTLLIAILGGVATLAVYSYFFEKPSEQLSTQTETISTISVLTAAQVIDSIEQSMTGAPSIDGAVSPPAVKIAGKSFYTQLQATDARVASRSELVPSTQADIERANLVKLLKDQGFEEKKLTASTPETVQISEFSHRDVVCTLHHKKTLNNDAADHSIAVTCANMTDYTELAAAQQPVMDSYKTARDASLVGDAVAVGAPKIAASSTQGYQTAEVSMLEYTTIDQPAVVGFVALFYRTPDDVWHFFKGTQSVALCTEYNTADLKKAYLNARCMGPNNQELKVAL